MTTEETKLIFNDYEEDVWADLESSNGKIVWTEFTISESQRIGVSMLVLRNLVKVDRKVRVFLDSKNGDNLYDWKVEFTRYGMGFSKQLTEIGRENSAEKLWDIQKVLTEWRTINPDYGPDGEALEAIEKILGEEKLHD